MINNSRVVTSPATARDIIKRCNGEASCPLTDLIFKKEDIEDKSKADWLLRAIAVSQILWLILNVATRHIAKLPVTQLEIATVAFSLMAVATYAANWWKPKDIVTSTVLNHSFSINAYEDRRNFRPFAKRLLTPSKADGRYVVPGRIENDIIWIESETPLISVLMAVSSLVFGGLHCLAWNFDFPTGAELVLWRVASLASGALPTFALGISLLSFRAVKFADKKSDLFILKAWATLDQFPPAWWDMLKARPKFLDWPPESWFAFRSLDFGTRDWDNAPDGLTDPPSQAEQSDERGQLAQKWCALANFKRDLDSAKKRWEIEKLEFNEISFVRFCRMALYDDEKLEINERSNVWLCRKALYDDDGNPKTTKLWDDYEDYLKTKLDPAGPRVPTIRCLSSILDIEAKFKYLIARTDKLKRNWDQASRFLVISIGILYMAARVTILVLLFTSLRLVPEGIYVNTPWTRFLPNIS